MIDQSPAPGARSIRHCGDILAITLTVDPSWIGSAWTRTNIGRGRIGRDEIIDQVEKSEPILARDWHDVPMAKVAPGLYELHLPLLETGCFDFKAFFVKRGEESILWPGGPNASVKVEPAGTVSSNSIYSAFVRQFGPSRNVAHSDQAATRAADMLEAAGYSVIPRSGTFRDLIRELDTIVDRMGFRIVQLLPIHPTPTTYARMGHFGSPFASLDFMDVDPSLAEFDRRTTPLDQFRELADALHARDARLFIDLPINHTGWASWLQIHHPEWFARNSDRSFQSPGAWGVTWEDLSRLDYRHRDLWRYMAEVFLHWCRQGVDGFRCDAGYMIPLDVWSYITAKVRKQFPDTVFLLEGLGGKQEVMESLLWRGNLDWAYSELFQNYIRAEIENCLWFSNRVSAERGLLVHFAETHDNNRLAATSESYAGMRTALAAMSSVSGGFGVTAGVEWFAQEKIDVHGAPSLLWGNKRNQVEQIARLNRILDLHPCFGPGISAVPVASGGGNAVVLRRELRDRSESLIIAANLDCRSPQAAAWPCETGHGPGAFPDLISGETLTVSRDGRDLFIELQPGRVVCLGSGKAVLPADPGVAGGSRWQRPRRQTALVTALNALQVCNPGADPREADVDAFLGDPEAFCRSASRAGYLPLVRFSAPADLKREVPVPPGHILLVAHANRFHFAMSCRGEVVHTAGSLADGSGGHFVLVPPLTPPGTEAQRREVTLTTWSAGHSASRESSSVLYLPAPGKATVRYSFSRKEALDPSLHAVMVNRHGTMSQVRAHWGLLHSAYDAFLAANLHPEWPVDRHVMLTRCRAWLVRRQYSQNVNGECLSSFSRKPGGPAVWQFLIPAGMGMNMALVMSLRLHREENAVCLTISRPLRSSDSRDALPDEEPATIILRPDVEDRLNHAVTKAYLGPERAWPQATKREANGFSFAPAGNRVLRMSGDLGEFVYEPAWQYMVHRPFEATRGLDSDSDLYSPGYFSIHLRGGQSCSVVAWIGDPDKPRFEDGADRATPFSLPLRDALLPAVKDFIVKRDTHRTVIAGYPWFLDWGRDTLIVLRGVIAAGLREEAANILLQFGLFEWKGTLPNVIRGNDDTNRDTSDAPLWYAVACSDMIEAGFGDEVLSTDCGGRTLLEIVRSIAEGYMSGTPNGIVMDKASGLVFSPSHFTWMDTNYPAGTPREGYPIEIQALWYATLRFLALNCPADGRWADLAGQVARSIREYYWDPGRGYLCDNLSAVRGTPAARAAADDALRPNQLLTLTLGAVSDREAAHGILRRCAALLVPGAIRSLADEAVEHPLPVVWKGVPLNDPLKPYWGRYEGDEDTRRKPAYHNGTAWTWLFPSYPEAMFMAWGEPARGSALALLESSTQLLNSGAVGHVPEILDGDMPHIQRGCSAQAWGSSELYRVLDKLTGAT